MTKANECALFRSSSSVVNFGVSHLFVLVFFFIIGGTGTLIAGERIFVRGDAIIMDFMRLETSESSALREIQREDANLFGSLVLDHPEVSRVVLSGPGGLNTAAYDIVHQIRAFGLRTEATGDCLSACAIIFLAGKERSINPGARLGFHRASTRAENHRQVYDDNARRVGWSDPFAYASAVYEFGQTSARDLIALVVQQGIDIEFGIRVLSFSASDMWYPSCDELEAGRVLTKRCPKLGR